jgi:hypothetical protein
MAFKDSLISTDFTATMKKLRVLSGRAFAFSYPSHQSAVCKRFAKTYLLPSIGHRKCCSNPKSEKMPPFFLCFLRKEDHVLPMR